MTQQRNIIIAVLALFLFTGITFANDWLVKIDAGDLNKVPHSTINRCNIRFQGKSYILIQGDSDLFNSDIFKKLDIVQPDHLYYMIGSKQKQAELNKIGKVIMESQSSILLRIPPSSQPKLITLGLPLSPLPESIKLDSDIKMSPKAELYSSSVIKSAIITEIANAVKKDQLIKFVGDLQENRDLDPPHRAYQSRYCLRVKNTDDPSDGACDNAAEYIYNKFKEYGLEVKYDEFPHEVLTQGKYQMRNVIATLPGKDKENQGTFIISSHYDSVASKSTNWQLSWKTMPAPGADDNASGVAAVLESARILSQYEFNSTIKFISFSGEELGLHGSRHYANTLFNNNEEIIGVINLDMIAYDPDTPDIDIVTNLGSEWLAEAMLAIQREYNLGSLILNKIVDPDMVYSDHASFWQNGYNAILGIEDSDFDSPEFNPFMHSEKDTTDKLNFDMMTDVCQIAIATLASLADPVNELPHPDLAVYESGIHLSNERPGINQPIELKAYIQNIGNADAKDVDVEVWLEEPLARAPRLISKQKIDVMAQKQVKITANFAISEWGESRMLVKVNPNYRIFETNGQNNLAIRTIKIGSNLLSMGKVLVYPNPAIAKDENAFNIEYTLSKNSDVKIEIYNIMGELIYVKEFRESLNGGKFGINKGIKWNGENIAGEKVASGLYICNITATASGVKEVASAKIYLLR